MFIDLIAREFMTIDDALKPPHCSTLVVATSPAQFHFGMLVPCIVPTTSAPSK